MVRRLSPAPAPDGADPLGGELERLAGMDLPALQARWRRVFGRAAPPGLTRALLARTLAYRIQADALGDLDRDTARALDRMRPGGTGEVIPLPETRTRPGTVLVREWQGSLHSVMILADGFGWNGSAYGSLSEVALAITGTKWNGPRFFGLRAKPPRQVA